MTSGLRLIAISSWMNGMLRFNITAIREKETIKGVCMKKGPGEAHPYSFPRIVPITQHGV